jgi:hypothetical protein
MSALSTASSMVRRRIDSLWSTTSLRTYLVVVILLATLPIASLMAYWILTDVQGRQRNTQLELQQAADSLARTLERELLRGDGAQRLPLLDQPCYRSLG